MPLRLRRLRVDPAVSSAAFITTVTDVIGLFFFLGLATLLMGSLVPARPAPAIVTAALVDTPQNDR